MRVGTHLAANWCNDVIVDPQAEIDETWEIVEGTLEFVGDDPAGRRRFRGPAGARRADRRGGREPGRRAGRARATSPSPTGPGGSSPASLGWRRPAQCTRERRRAHRRDRPSSVSGRRSRSSWCCCGRCGGRLATEAPRSGPRTPTPSSGRSWVSTAAAPATSRGHGTPAGSSSRRPRSSYARSLGNTAWCCRREIAGTRIEQVVQHALERPAGAGRRDRPWRVRADRRQPGAVAGRPAAIDVLTETDPFN